MAAASPLPKVEVSLKAEPQRSYVYDDTGKLMTTLFDVDRAPVKLQNVPQQLIDVVLAIEDRKFWAHNGVDWAGTFRALFRNVDSGTVEQGASTIAEQLVKNTLTKGLERDLKTKIREAGLAMRLEHELTKNQILERLPEPRCCFGNERVRHRGRGRALLQRGAGPTSRCRRRRCSPGSIAGAVGASTRSSTPARGHASRRTSAATRWRETRQDHAAPAGAAQRSRRCRRAVVLPADDAPRAITSTRSLGQLQSPNPVDPWNPANVLGRAPVGARTRLYEGGLKHLHDLRPERCSAAGGRPPIADGRAANAAVHRRRSSSIDNSSGAVRASRVGEAATDGREPVRPSRPTEPGPRKPVPSFKVFTLATALETVLTPTIACRRAPLAGTIQPRRRQRHRRRLAGRLQAASAMLAHGDRRSPTTARSCAPELSLGPGNYGSRRRAGA